MYADVFILYFYLCDPSPSPVPVPVSVPSPASLAAAGNPPKWLWQRLWLNSCNWNAVLSAKQPGRRSQQATGRPFRARVYERKRFSIKTKTEGRTSSSKGKRGRRRGGAMKNRTKCALIKNSHNL